jgi:2Fe-2S ferredoxin
MVKINYTTGVSSDCAKTADVPVGSTVMRGALSCNFEGVIAECGGSCACATCHVHVDRQWLDKLDPATPEEEELLEYLDHSAPNSRLSCQLMVSEDLEGMTVRTPSDETAVVDTSSAAN